MLSPEKVSASTKKLNKFGTKIIPLLNWKITFQPWKKSGQSRSEHSDSFGGDLQPKPLLNGLRQMLFHPELASSPRGIAAKAQDKRH
jgi:hypothetical protein